MTDTIWPANAMAGAPEYDGRMLRQVGTVAYAGATSARPLGARSGVRPGTPSNTVTATSTTWTCKPFAGVADVMTAAEAAAYAFAFDANATGSIAAAHATLARKDIIYVSVADPAESVGAAPTVTRKYLAGSASGTPSAPAVPGTERGFVIAEINVPASGGGSPTVSWVAPYMAAAGGVVPFNTKAQMVATTTLPAGTLATVLAEPGSLYESAGTTWGPRHKLVRQIAGTASGSLSGSTWLNLGPAQTIPASPFGAGVPYELSVLAVSNATLSGNAYALRVRIDGTVSAQAQDVGTGGVTVEVTSSDIITAPNSTHTVEVQILSLSGTATVSTGAAISYFVITLERAETF